MIGIRKLIFVGCSILLAGSALAQVPDVLNSLDSGGRAMGVGGALYGTGADTHSVLSNPAGLAYIDGAQIEVTFRNLPASKTLATNDFRNPTLSSSGSVGNQALGHIGYVRRLNNSKTTIGFSYQVVGYVNDEKTGVGDLTLDSGTSVRNFFEKTKAKIDFYTLSIGKPMGNGGTTAGLGIIFANSYVRDFQSYSIVAGGNVTPTTPTDVSGTGTGFGVVAGIQHVPQSNKNMVIGLSARSPIKLSTSNGTDAFLDRIPGLLDLGIAVRKTGMGSDGSDYVLGAAHINQTFSGGGGSLLAQRTKTGGGFGLEYNKDMGDFRLPIRIGYELNPGGGAPVFKDRNLLTLGVGYRPNGGDTWFDLGLGYASSGGMDAAFSITHRLK